MKLARRYSCSTIIQSVAFDDELLRQLMKQVVTTHQQLRGMTTFVAQSSYLQIMRRQRDYGKELYRVKVTTSSNGYIIST